jgi:lysozyme
MNSTIKKGGAGALVGAALTAAIALVAPWEGKRNSTYLDIVDVPTICYGHTGPEVKLGQTLSDAKCKDLLSEDLQEANDAINRCVKVPLKPNERAAFVSFTYNLGGGAFCKSTLLRKLNTGDVVGACNEMPKWVNAGGKRVQGLVNRRAAERNVCLGGAQ